MTTRGCPTCSAAVAEGARFCRHCGASQDEPTVTVLDATAAAAAPPASDPGLGPPSPVSPPPPAAPPPTASKPAPAVPVALIVGVMALFALVGGVTGYLLVVKPAGGGGTPADAADLPATVDAAGAVGPDEPGRAAYSRQQRDGYTLEAPLGWRLVDDSVDKGYGIRSSWEPPESGDVSVLVDYTRGFEGTPLAAARELRAGHRKVTGYQEVSFGTRQLGGVEVVEWRFVNDGVEKVDYFSEACGTGYAVLGTAPAVEFESYLVDFEHAAATLEPDC